jgi:tetratricopeptide (TPR) repeat protein
VAAGLTQTDLAGDRFSKEYISQIERGKTRPTTDTVDWLAGRLRTDAGYLANGVQTVDLARAEAVLAQADALATAGEWSDAVAKFQEAQPLVAATGIADLEFHRALGLAWALMERGETRAGVDLLVEMQTWPSFADFAELDRAEYLFRLGVGRVRLNSTHVALGLLTEALRLAQDSHAHEGLVAGILSWRSICLQRLRDHDLAREDAEHAVELGERAGDVRSTAYALFQASLTAARDGRYVSARRYAERARAKYEEIDDRAQLAKMLTVLGGVAFLARDLDAALRHFKKAVGIFLDAGNDALCGVAIGSVAQVLVEQGELVQAEEQARLSVAKLGADEEWAHETGEAYHTLGLALMRQERLDEAAEAFASSADLLESVRAVGELARTVLAQGDLARMRGDGARAAELYRRSAEMLQDTHF